MNRHLLAGNSDLCTRNTTSLYSLSRKRSTYDLLGFRQTSTDFDIFGQNVNEKASSQKQVYLPTSPACNCSAPGKTWKNKKCTFRSKSDSGLVNKQMLYYWFARLQPVAS